MLMDYVGSLKTLLLWPLFQIWHPGVWSIRLPVCLISAGTLLLFALIVARVADTRVALGAALLLAPDASFIFTNTFDWGPVALLLLGALGFLALFVRFARSGSSFALSAAFLLAGVMLWYKVIFAFPLVGVLIASASVFPRRTWGRTTGKNFLVAVGSLLIGASPLIFFNFHTGGGTLKASSYLVRTSAWEKVMMLHLTLNGKALEHYMVRSSPGEMLPLHGARLGELVESWYRHSTLGPGSLLFAALIVSAAALPFLRASRLFRVITFAWVTGLSIVSLFFASGTAGGRAAPLRTRISNPTIYCCGNSCGAGGTSPHLAAPWAAIRGPRVRGGF
jgi:hypothetical protein